MSDIVFHEMPWSFCGILSYKKANGRALFDSLNLMKIVLSTQHFVLSEKNLFVTSTKNY